MRSGPQGDLLTLDKIGDGGFGGLDREEERGGWMEGYLGLGLVGVGEKGKSRVNPALEVGWLGAIGHRGYWGLQVCGSGRRGSPVWGILGSGCHETLHAGADLGILTA